MKLKFYENEWGLDLHLEPETLEEVNQMARFVNNAKQEPPQMYMQFTGQAPSVYISMQKVQKHLQRNSISSKKQK